jgi:hypothetical protein
LIICKKLFMDEEIKKLKKNHAIDRVVCFAINIDVCYADYTMK